MVTSGSCILSARPEQQQPPEAPAFHPSGRFLVNDEDLVFELRRSRLNPKEKKLLLIWQSGPKLSVRTGGGLLKNACVGFRVCDPAARLQGAAVHCKTSSPRGCIKECRVTRHTSAGVRGPVCVSFLPSI